MTGQLLLWSLVLCQAPADGATPPPAAQDARIEQRPASPKRQHLLHIQTRLEGALDCRDCESLWSDLSCEAYSRRDQAFCYSVKLRLQQRRCGPRLPNGGARPATGGSAGTSRPTTRANPDTRPDSVNAAGSSPHAVGPSAAPTATQLLDAFERLDEEVQRERGEPSAPAELPALERELTWLAVATLHEWPPGSREANDIGGRLAILLWPGAVNSGQIRTAIQRLLKEGKLTPAQLDRFVEMAHDACVGADPGSTTCRHLAQQLDERNMEALARTLSMIRSAYDALDESGQLARSPASQLDHSDPVLFFFDHLDRIAALETKASAAERGAIPPRAPVAPFLVLWASRAEGRPSCPDADPQDAYRHVFVSKLSGLGLGVKPAGRVEPEDLNEVPARLPQLLAGDDVADQSSHLCRGYPPLCDPPYAGVLLLQFEPDGTDSVQVSVDWWARGASEPDHERLRGGSLRSCDRARVALDARLAAENVFAQLPTRVIPPERLRVAAASPPPSPSPWLAAAFAGAPFLADEKASTANKVVFTTLDAGLLGGAVYFAGASIHHRNEYAAGSSRSLAAANEDTRNALFCLGGILGVRLAAGLVYALGRGSP